MKRKFHVLFLVFSLFMVLCIALPVLAEGSAYPALSVSIDDVGSPVCPPQHAASISVTGGSGTFSYQWYYTKSLRADGTVASPSKGTALKGETAASFNGTATAKTAGKYLYCQVTDTMSGEKAYSTGRRLLLLPPVESGGSPQSASICYDTITVVLADNYAASHAYNVDNFGAAVAKSKKVALGDGTAAKSVSYSSKTNTVTVRFPVDLSKLPQPFQLAMQPASYEPLTLSISGVTPIAETVTLSKAAASLMVGQHLTLKASPVAAAWQSSNPAVATVNSKGLVQAVGSGTATITATSKKGGTATCQVTVTETSKPAQIGGSGSVTLQLQTGSNASCYKLYATGAGKDVLVRLVYLDAHTSGSMSFAPGTYVLKIASGQTWLGDDQAFGKRGSYSQSDAYAFTDGTYTIESSTTHGDFRSSSMGGFVN